MTEPYSKVKNGSLLWNSFQETTDASVPSDIINSSGGATTFVDSATGSLNPGWRATIRNGGDATSNFDAVRHQVEGDPSYFYYRSGFWLDPRFPATQLCSGVANLKWQNDSINAGISLVADVRNRAIRKFLDNAKSVRSSFEAGQDLGEIKQTIESLIHPMNSLKQLTLNYFTKLKKAKVKNKDRISLHKALSDSYLEYRFGWRPLALDLADAFAGLTSRRRMSSTAPCQGSATGSEATDHHSDVNCSSVNCDAPAPLNSYSYTIYSCRIKGAIRLNLDSNGNIPIPQLLQLSTLNDFAVTAWDLLPYSFVVDYFTNIGDVINALTFPSSDLVFICQTEHTKLINQYSSSPVHTPDSNGYIWKHETWRPFNARTVVTKVSRRRLQSIDLLPSVRVSLPVSSRPLENIGALISSNVKSLVPFFKRR